MGSSAGDISPELGHDQQPGNDHDHDGEDDYFALHARHSVSNSDLESDTLIHPIIQMFYKEKRFRKPKYPESMVKRPRAISRPKTMSRAPLRTSTACR